MEATQRQTPRAPIGDQPTHDFFRRLTTPECERTPSVGHPIRSFLRRHVLACTMLTMAATFGTAGGFALAAGMTYGVALAAGGVLSLIASANLGTSENGYHRTGVWESPHHVE